ncbi:MucR family transcriptional regulator, partial [Mesorhizobium sp.]
PAVNPKRSVFPDHIVCLEDGKKFKSLKRHLATDHGLTPDEYRAKWGLAPDYPMVAPSYSATRSALAKSSGL